MRKLGIANADSVDAAADAFSALSKKDKEGWLKEHIGDRASSDPLFYYREADFKANMAGENVITIYDINLENAGVERQWLFKYSKNGEIILTEIDIWEGTSTVLATETSQSKGVFSQDLLEEISNSTDTDYLVDIINSQNSQDILKFHAFNRLGQLRKDGKSNYDINILGETLAKRAETFLKSYINDENNSRIFEESPYRDAEIGAIAAAAIMHLKYKYPQTIPDKIKLTFRTVVFDYNTVAAITSQTNYQDKGDTRSTMIFGDGFTKRNFDILLPLIAHEFYHNIQKELDTDGVEGIVGIGFPYIKNVNAAIAEMHSEAAALLLAADLGIALEDFKNSFEYTAIYEEISEAKFGTDERIFVDHYNGARGFLQGLIRHNGKDLSAVQSAQLVEAIFKVMIESAEKYRTVDNMDYEGNKNYFGGSSEYFKKILSRWSGIAEQDITIPNSNENFGNIGGQLPTNSVFEQAVNANKNKKEPIVFWHGTPFDFDKFDINKIGQGEGISKYGKGIYLSRGKRLAPFYANIRSKDAPIHFGRNENLENPQPRILEVHAPADLNILRVSAQDAKKISRNQQQWERENPDVDGIELSDSDQIIIFTKSLDKLSIVSKYTIDEFVENNSDVEFREWTTNAASAEIVLETAAASAVQTANPAQGLAAAQEIAVKSVLTKDDVGFLTQDDLNLSDNLIVFNSYDLSTMETLRNQGFRVAYSYSDVSNQSPKAVDGWKKVIRGVYARVNTAGITEIMFNKVDLETGNENLAQDINDGIKFEAFEGVKQIVITNETTASSVINAMKNRHTDSVNTPVKERVLNLYKIEDISNFENLCRNENKANDIGVFTINEKQAEKFSSSIKKLQNEGMRFVVETKNYNEIHFDGIRLNATDEKIDRLIGKDGILEKLKTLKAQAFSVGIDARITISLSQEVLKDFAKNGVDIWKQYGVLPIASNKTDYLFKAEMEFEQTATIDDIKKILDKDNVAALSVADSKIFALNLYDDRIETLKETLKQAKTAKQRYDKGLKASLDSRFAYTASNISALFSLVNADRTNEDKEMLKADIKKAVSNAGLSEDSLSYINYLLEKERYYETLGFIRGIVMNSVREEYKDVLEKKGIILDIDKFKNIQGGKYQKAILTLLVQLKMSGQINNTEALEKLTEEKVKGEDNYFTTKEFLDAIGLAINVNIDDILRNNEYEITPIKENEKAAVAEMLKQFNVLVQERFIKAEPNKKVQTSMIAVRSILSAA
jgi:hypothetical protein